MSTPTSRSLEFLRGQGYTAEVVERYNSFTRRRNDFLGFADILAFKIGVRGVLAVQTTSGSNASARIEKIRQEPKAGLWLAAGNQIVVHGWAKRGPRGKRKVWTCRETVFPTPEPSPE